MGSPKGERYDEAFKREAVRLVVEEKQPYTRVARDLGIAEETLRRWILDAGQRTVDETEKTDKQRIRELERALKRAEMERDILKEAVGLASFSQRPK
ncbi:MAG: transposase ['Candidatus Kapabacteria' thiocyanatum]|uniref:Transposase n=1 Tax=Candidatus Kapaibacterium thiocyanatum TaxID=1895771 RepID=A0A1M3L3Q2_9BACT|nr:transposase ['Candidatus Kapabacteria' thiocyanatum]OJX59976.1 MAG: hypothetical protein BGO89_08260 ['Candidatus Kapabacteria' thiocyanatum]